VPSDPVEARQEQQGAHAPQPRAHVEMAAQTIVVAQEAQPDPAELAPTREFAKYTGSAEPTVVIRDRRAVNQLRQISARRKRRPWASVAILGLAGLVAFVVGGLLAVMTTNRAGDASAPAAPPAAAVPTQRRVEPELRVSPSMHEAPKVEAVEPSELPIESDTSPRTLPSARPRNTNRPAPRASSTVPTATPDKADIPSGI
jgi:hypothetical protein